MAKFKNVGIVVFAVLMFFGVCAMSAGCSDGDKIKELQQQVAELKNQIGEQNDKNEELQQELEKLSDKVHKLVIQTASFVHLEDAYDTGLLTQADLMSIAYYYFGSTIHNEEIMGEGYIPAPKSPEALDDETELLIRESWAKKYNESRNSSEAAKTEKDFTILNYCGTYNGCVAVQLDDKNVCYPAVYAPIPIEVGGVNFIYQLYGPPPIHLWKI